jgi:hypothetical protein
MLISDLINHLESEKEKYWDKEIHYVDFSYQEWESYLDDQWKYCLT